MNEPCAGCLDEARERNREMDSLLIQAKKEAIEDNKPKAICRDEVTGLFIADAYTAFRENFLIQQVVSGLQ